MNRFRFFDTANNSGNVVGNKPGKAAPVPPPDGGAGGGGGHLLDMEQQLLHADFVYYNANRETLQQEKIDRQTEQDIQALIRLNSEQQGQQRYEAAIEWETQRLRALLLWLSAQEFGLRLYDPLSAQKHADLLFQPRANHQCTSTQCMLFSVPKGQLFPNLYRRLEPGEPVASTSSTLQLGGLRFGTITSSGLIFICRHTGQVHVCDGDCKTSTVDLEDESRGHFCAISGQLKAQIMSDLPVGRNIRISRARVDKLNSGHKAMMLLSVYTGDLGYADEGAGDDTPDDLADGEYTSAPSYVQRTEREEAERERKRMDQELESDYVNPANEEQEIAAAANDGDANAAEEEIEELDPEADNELPDIREADEIEELLDSQSSDDASEDLMGANVQDPYLEVEKKKKAAAATAAVQSNSSAPELSIPRGSSDKIIGPQQQQQQHAPSVAQKLTAFELPNDPDARTQHFLKNPEQRRTDILSLLDRLLSFQSQHSVWLMQLGQEAGRAVQQLTSYRRRHKHLQMPVSLQYVFLVAHATTYTAPRPVLRDPLPLQPYCDIITRAWNMIANSPYIRKYNKPRLIPNLVSTVLGLMYNMAQGPVIWDCSLSKAELARIPAGLEVLDVRNLKVPVLPYDPELNRRLLSVDQLHYLDLAKKRKTQGFRCFNDCLASTVEQLRRELAQGIQAGRTREALIHYVDACDRLNCNYNEENMG